MLKSTAMLLQELSTYANPMDKIRRMAKDGKVHSVVRGLYETDSASLDVWSARFFRDITRQLTAQ